MTIDHAQYENQVKDFFTCLSPEVFHHVKCPLCPYEKGIHKHLFTKGTMEVVQCHCGMVFNWRQPTQQALDDFYTQSEAMRSWAGMKEASTSMEGMRQKFGRIAFKTFWYKVERALDIGCGNGHFLDLLPGSKMKRIGIDQGKEAVEYASKRGIEAYKVSIDDYFSQPHEKLDAISLWGVLEHYKHPEWLIQKCWESLRPGGKIIVCVPNFDSQAVKVFGRDTFTFCPQHLWYFQPKNLFQLLSPYFTVEDFFTVEPEARQIYLHEKGLNPYDNSIMLSPDESAHVKRMETNILALNLGYKMIYQGERIDCDSPRKGWL